MAYYVPDESCSSNWSTQNETSYRNFSEHIWHSEVGTGVTYQRFEGGPVPPHSIEYPPEWGYHTTTHVVADDSQAYNYKDMISVPVEQGVNVFGGDVSAASRIGPGPVSPFTEHNYSGPGDYPRVYQAHDLSQAYQDIHSNDLHEQRIYTLNSGLPPAQSKGVMVTNDRRLTPISSASPQSSSYLNRQCASPRSSGDAEHSVPCPYHCGTILTGVHAVGNLTRHIRSRSCTTSGKAKAKHLCPINGCRKEYTRSDGLKVHMRRRHNAPAALPKNSPNAEKDGKN